jgi:hypothetical protein
VLVYGFDDHVFLSKSLDVSINLPSLLILVDLELGVEGALSLKLSLAVGLALCLELCLALRFAVNFA